MEIVLINNTSFLIFTPKKWQIMEFFRFFVVKNHNPKSVVMKKIFLLMPLFLAFNLVSCGGNDGEVSEDNTDSIASADFDGMNEISLSEYGLNMGIMLPQVESATGSSIEPTIAHADGDYLWYVDIGTHFHMIIEDYGNEKNKVGNEKERLADLERIFTIEYIVDEPNLIMYKRTLHEGQGGKTSYHCYGETTIEGYTYVLHSDEDGSLKPIIEDMVKTIRSAIEITAS